MKHIHRTVFKAALLMAVATSSHADMFSGWYAGGQLGGSQNNTHITTPSDNQGNTLYQKNYSKRGVLLGAVGGWGKTMNNGFYWGGEANLNYDAGDQKKLHSVTTTDANTGATTTANFSTKYKRGPVLGLNGRGGYLMNPNTLLYTKVGVELSRESYSWSNVFTQNASGKLNYSSNNGSSQETTRKNAIRPVLGLGTEYAFTKTISGRLEYAYTFKGPNMKTTNTSGTVDSKAYETSHALLAGAVYHF